MDELREELKDNLKNLLKPHLREEGNVDYLTLNIIRLVDVYTTKIAHRMPTED